MTYYHNLVTTKSWEELKNLRKISQFTLLGGWAVYLYTKGQKSKDIDILVDYSELPKLKQNFEFIKNDRLHKYEAIRGPVQIDIYTPHYSKLGIPVESLLANSQVIDGFRVISPEYLIALKCYTLNERARTPKGRKDFLDLISLYLSLGAKPFTQSIRLLEEYNLSDSLRPLIEILAESTSVPELGLSTHQYAHVKQSLRKILV